MVLVLVEVSLTIAVLTVLLNVIDVDPVGTGSTEVGPIRKDRDISRYPTNLREEAYREWSSWCSLRYLNA